MGSRTDDPSQHDLPLPSETKWEHDSTKRVNVRATPHEVIPSALIGMTDRCLLCGDIIVKIAEKHIFKIQLTGDLADQLLNYNAVIGARSLFHSLGELRTSPVVVFITSENVNDLSFVRGLVAMYGDQIIVQEVTGTAWKV